MRHPKFLALNGNATSLWHEAKDYCASHLTDGLIPREAMKTFRFNGVKSVSMLLTSIDMVKPNGMPYAPLWEVHPIGFKMHDYLDHNDSREVVLERIDDANDVAELKKIGNRERQQKARTERKTKIAAASRPVTDLERDAERDVTRDRGGPTVTTTPTETPVVHTEHEQPSRVTARSDDPPLDRWFVELKAAYPDSAVSSGHMTEQAFVEAVLSRRTPGETFALMLANLDGQKRGQQWKQKRMIPRLDRWLREGLWEQRHEPVEAPGAPTVAFDPTAGCPHEPKCLNAWECQRLGVPV